MVVVKLLLEKGFEADAKDSNGHSPLFWSAEFGHPEIMELLLGKGVEADATDADGRTPLSSAAANGRKVA
ncbi:ankyrin repeat-containing domain protein [Penicillium canescens]|uniref:Ankyrin repeat-containing domain protein n=2 Tax=Penicillium canescens TaxID=5083 RepID=A0AAD6IBI5_PENCN|nr:ankyrin repeat-containing domain protein [Penicillium canescens]